MWGSQHQITIAKAIAQKPQLQTTSNYLLI